MPIFETGKKSVNFQPAKVGEQRSKRIDTSQAKKRDCSQAAKLDQKQYLIQFEESETERKKEERSG